MADFILRQHLMQESYRWENTWATDKSHERDGGDWEWLWEELRRQPVSQLKEARCNQQAPQCWFCRRAWEAWGENTNDLFVERYSRITSGAGCEGTAKTDTSTHHCIWRQLYDIMHAAQKPKSKFEFVTLDKQSNMSTLWSQKKLLKICNREHLTGKEQK